jgi:ADP-heptose:LPS heptosyltransferase
MADFFSKTTDKLLTLYYKAQFHFPLFLKKQVSSSADKLLIVSDDHLGDLLMLAGVISKVRQNFKVTLAVQEELAFIAVLMGADELITFNRDLYIHSLIYRRGFLNSLRSRGFYIAVSSILLSRIGTHITARSGAKFRYAYIGNAEGIKYKRRLMYINKTITPNNFMDNEGVYKDILESISHYYANITGMNLKINDCIPFINKDISPYPGLSGKKYLLYISDTTSTVKTYPVLRLIPKLKTFAKKNDLELVITAVKKNNAVSTDKSIVDLTGKTTLSEMVSIVNNAAVVIGNDTGMTHLAWILGRPTLSIFSGILFGRFRQHNKGHKIYNYMPCFADCTGSYCMNKKDGVGECILSITPEQIIAALENLYCGH